MTLKAITFLPTDDNWNIQKIPEKNEDTSSTLYKKMIVENLNLYWDENPTSWIDKKEDEIMKLIK
jgi:hypothetical protein